MDQKAFQSGQKSIEHLSKYDFIDTLYDMTIENNVWNCPTIVVYENQNRALANKEFEGVEYISPLSLAYWKDSLVSNPIQTKGLKYITKRLHDEGGKILLGTDANNPFIVPGFSIHDELYNFVNEANSI